MHLLKAITCYYMAELQIINLQSKFSKRQYFKDFPKIILQYAIKKKSLHYGSLHDFFLPTPTILTFL